MTYFLLFQRRLIVLTVLTLAVVGGINKWAFAATSPNVSDRLIVHEWGTFTELQDDIGHSVAGINTDDEPVPSFVHRLPAPLLAPVLGVRQVRRMKAVAYRHPQVTMRLETPIIYFYPPSTQTKPMTVDVDVHFRSGWLSEFYPNAHVNAPGLKRLLLNRNVVGSLAWHGLQIGGEGELPATDEPVWLLPRKTNAATVTNSAGESEQYLFYRGVGNFTGPLRVTTDRDADTLTLTSRFHTFDTNEVISIRAAWLVHVKRDGSLAYRSLGQLTAPPEQTSHIAQVKRGFETTDYSSRNIHLLHEDMHKTLTIDGLYDDEATALLSTWERAYFKSPGLRLFYVVPRQWTDDRLPLTVSVPARINRVMIGRIELVSDTQRALIDEIKNGPVASAKWMNNIPETAARNKFFAGRSDFGDLGVEIPADYQRYLDLGRFRNALLRYELQQRPSKSLHQFIAQYGLATPVVTEKSERFSANVLLRQQTSVR